ncbi:lipocalin family protein [Acinetobacter terrestris]|uniref:Outer membrane lipoprotein Blc n=2 Tax=Acinetobacter terrestris TaxID=2529843 RepID=A0AAW6UN63_9GAMM|nr:lipocalin family protein [Acinetobacter terrestris]MDK1683394.1 lipocalin family protein [Acinetobacter terrestris]
MAIGASSISTLAHAQTEPLQAVEKIELNKYLGTWHEVARKPLYFQRKCDSNVTANYSLNENGNIKVDNSCYTKDGKFKQTIGEAFVQNAPSNSKLKVSFLPKIIRSLPVGRGDYWVLKIDENYETVLVGEPDKKYMWILSRSQQPQPEVVQEYLNYAESIGYDLSDVIKTKQTQK